MDVLRPATPLSQPLVPPRNVGLLQIWRNNTPTKSHQDIKRCQATHIRYSKWKKKSLLNIAFSNLHSKPKVLFTHNIYWNFRKNWKTVTLQNISNSHMRNASFSKQISVARIVWKMAASIPAERNFYSNYVCICIFGKRKNIQPFTTNCKCNAVMWLCNEKEHIIFHMEVPRQQIALQLQCCILERILYRFSYHFQFYNASFTSSVENINYFLFQSLHIFNFHVYRLLTVTSRQGWTLFFFQGRSI